MDDVEIYHPTIGLIGRIMFTLIFFASGITHFTDLATYASMIPPWLPLASFWVIISGIVELAGAVMVLFNYMPRLGAWLIVLFLIPVTAAIHGYMLATAPDATMMRIQQSFVLKGITMAGAALIFTQVGVKRGQ